ncbi:MAG: mechanosensitive ion channel family protein [Gammaproteobacteria bacterium]|nr:mechanosensitive ion channel family protein [Gammaproteobacteria bacterium]
MLLISSVVADNSLQQNTNAIISSESQTDNQTKKSNESITLVDLSSPRSTMRSFLLAIQDANNQLPNRIEDATKCLNLSKLEGSNEEIKKQAALIAQRLSKLIDKIGVNVDDIPDSGIKNLWYFFELKDKKHRYDFIALQYDKQSKNWLFSPGTLKSLPVLENYFVKQQTNKTIENISDARNSPRATMASFLKAMNYEATDYESAIQCLDSSEIEATAWQTIAQRRAVELKNVIDKIRYVILSEIPDENTGEPYIWYTSTNGNISLQRINSGDYKGEWRFSAETINDIPKLYKAFENQQILAELRARGSKEMLTIGMRIEKNMPEWLRDDYLALQVWQWLGLVLVIFVCWIIRLITPSILSFVLSPFIQKIILCSRNILKDAFDSSGILVAFIVWFYSIHYFQLPANLLAFLVPISKFMITFSLLLTGYRIVDVLGEHIISNRNIQLTSNDELLIPLITKILRLLVVFAVILFILEFWFNQPPSTVIGALGIGGVALALAAKDTLGNFFGSITVLVDKPFSVGDWIEIGDVEGTVEHVGFRSTRIRTFYNSMITIPNSRMVDSHVDNYGARKYRRIKTYLNLTYDTPPEKIDAFCEGIRELVRLHPFTRKDYYHVYFNQFADSSLNILLYIFLETPDWSTELRERHNLFLDIIHLSKKLDVSFAFPSQTLYFDNDSSHKHNEIDNSEILGVEKAAEVYENVQKRYYPKPEPVVISQAPSSKK